MALEDADRNEIREIMKEVLAEQNKGGDDKGGKSDEEDDLHKKAAEAAAAEKAQKEREDAIAESVKFNGKAHSFITENIDYFGGATGEKLLEMVQNNTKNEKEVERANEYRKQFIDQFIQQQSNIDVLPDGSKDLIAKYQGLTQEEQRKQSAKYWAVIESGLEIHKQMKKAKQLELAKTAGADSAKEVPKHILVPKQTDNK